MKIDQFNNYVKFFRFILKYYNSDVLKSASNTVMNGIVDEEDNAENFSQNPQELAEDLKNMGPTYVKLGQLLSTRPDLLPEPYLNALAELQDDVATIPFEEVEKIFEEEIGIRIKNVFAEFDREPLGSASIGQVHKAKLKSGRDVAVKIQRPGVRKNFVDDLKMLKEMGDMAVKYSKEARKYSLDQMIDELQHILLNELDYTKEVQNLGIIRENLSQYKNIVFPAPVLELCTGKIITMDFVEGKKITALGKLQKMETDYTPAVNDLVEGYLKQVVVDGFAHADPHPGNIFVTPDNKIALMDMGMVAKFSPRLQEKVMMLMVGMSKKDGDAITDALLEMSDYGKDVNLENFRKNINRLVLNATSTNAEDMETGRLLLQMNKIAADEGIKLPVELNILGKILLNMDQIVAVLTPKYDLQSSIKTFMERIVNEKMVKELKPENFYGLLLENKKLAENLPGRLNKITENLATGQFTVKVDAIDEQRFTDGFQKVANRITSGLIIAAMIIGASLLMRIPSTFLILGYSGMPFIFFIIAIALGFYLVWTIMFKDETYKRKDY